MGEQCLILLGGTSESEAALKSVAEQYYTQAGKDVESMSIRFFSGKAGGVTEQLRKLTGVTEDKLVMLDIPDDGGFYICDADKLSTDVLNQFLSDVAAKKSRAEAASKMILAEFLLKYVPALSTGQNVLEFQVYHRSEFVQ